ncbi:hypothetical protein L6452_03360 [Arctium lappa]|uniref:Uncharacterized protein n=1 Tax=Arctium lappa TaxID=4217 RepID=A0ACB9FLG5_ARCLA|nr:hypothetical protein L6452_03360 [Arctium lappa]
MGKSWGVGPHLVGRSVREERLDLCFGFGEAEVGFVHGSKKFGWEYHVPDLDFALVGAGLENGNNERGSLAVGEQVVGTGTLVTGGTEKASSDRLEAQVAGAEWS